MRKLVAAIERQARLPALASLYLMLPLSLAAHVLYQQPYTSLLQVGRLLHIVSVICVFVAGTVFACHLASKIAIALVMPLALFFAGISENARTIYLVILMYAFFLTGLALIEIDARYVRRFVIALACISLPVMLLQFYGWPFWINSLATHGLTGEHIGVGLQPTLGVKMIDLKAILWQVRTAGVFASNQMNTLFFFVFFAFAITLRSRGRMSALPLLALYAALTISKAAIVGSVILSLILAVIYRDEYVKKAIMYVLWLTFTLAVLFLLFPGVMQTYIGPYNFLVSLMARVFDLLDSMNQQELIDAIVTFSKHSSVETLQFAVGDTVRAFAAAKTDTTFASVDYSIFGNLTLFSEISRAPLLSLAIIGLATVVGGTLNYPNLCWWRFSPLQICLTLGLVIFAVVAAVASQQSYWMFVGMALPCVYGALVLAHAVPGLESNASATLRSNSESMSGDRSGGIS